MDAYRRPAGTVAVRTEGRRGVKLGLLHPFAESCWNHGNAHFLRGVLRELLAAAMTWRWSPAESWSRDNLLRDHGEAGLDAFRTAYPELRSQTYEAGIDLPAPCDGADLVIVHEWNDPGWSPHIGRARRHGGRFCCCSTTRITARSAIPRRSRGFDLDDYDGVLAFGETLAAVYRRWGWGRASSSGMRPPIPGCSIHRPRKAARGPGLDRQLG